MWSYYTLVVRNSEARDLDDTLNTFGADGWEMVSAVSTVKTWFNLRGNEIVMVLKKPGAGHVPRLA